MDKKQTLEEVIKCFENLISTIGEITTEYHWREFCGLIENIKNSFPEYDLDKFQNSLFTTKINNIPYSSDNIHWD